MRAISRSIFLLIFIYAATANGQYRAAPWVGADLSGATCKGGQGVGPLDYTNPNHRNTHLYDMVIGAHFNDRVRTLKGGAKKGHGLWSDIDYTLRGIPNHHHALNSMMRYQFVERNKGGLLRTNSPPTICYLKRAINFSPRDYVPLMLLGMFYDKRALSDQALTAYKNAEAIQPNKAELLYNMGLLHLKMGNNEEALSYAKKAYSLGYPLPGLKKKLSRMGVWK